MPRVTLQSTPGPSSAVPKLVDYGGNQVPFLGGPVSHLDRLGTRFALDVTLPPMRNNAALAMAWVADLLRGKRDGVTWEWPQPDIIPPPNCVTTGAAASMAEELTLAGIAAGTVVPKGSFLSLLVADRYYLHNVFQGGVVGGGETLAIQVTPAFRVPIPSVTQVKFNPAIFQGYLEGNELAWNIDLARTVGLSFTIVEEE